MRNKKEQAMKKIQIVLMLLVMILTITSCADTTVRGSVYEITASGNAMIDRMPQKVLEILDIGDTVLVSIGGHKLEMPFVDELIREDGTLQLVHDTGESTIYICLYNQNFSEVYGIKANDRVFISKK